jgi:hypothetical protein
LLLLLFLFLNFLELLSRTLLTPIQGGGDEEYVVALHSDDGAGGNSGRTSGGGGGGGGTGMTAPLAFALFVASCSQFLVGYVRTMHSSLFHCTFSRFQKIDREQRGNIEEKNGPLWTEDSIAQKIVICKALAAHVSLFLPPSTL